MSGEFLLRSRNQLPLDQNICHNNLQPEWTKSHNNLIASSLLNIALYATMKYNLTVIEHYSKNKLLFCETENDPFPGWHCGSPAWPPDLGISQGSSKINGLTEEIM